MVRKTERLTARRVEQVRKAGRYHDKSHGGLYLQVGPTGTKSWLLRYENNRREGFVTLSAFGRGECSGQQASCGGGCRGPSAE